VPDLCYKGANASWLFSSCVSVVLHPPLSLLFYVISAPLLNLVKVVTIVVTYKTNFYVHFDVCANFDALHSYKPILMANGHAQSYQVYKNLE
jgi:hypothetical protein